jgi:hypothetical protein
MRHEFWRRCGPVHPNTRELIERYYAVCGCCKHARKDHSSVSGKCWLAGCKCAEWVEPADTEGKFEP